MSIPQLAIGQLARQTGCNVQTIRYYEQVGLLATPSRNVGNQRRYDLGTLQRLAFIRHSRELGFSLAMIRELLDLAEDPDRPCAAADSIARRQLQQVESRISRLLSLQRELQRMITECQGEKVAECRVIEVLADHSRCASEHMPHREG
jgi:DNA-binding transcriptional MerR regulator